MKKIVIVPLLVFSLVISLLSFSVTTVKSVASPTNTSPTNTSPTNTSPTNTSPTNTSPTNTSPANSISPWDETTKVTMPSLAPMLAKVLPAVVSVNVEAIKSIKNPIFPFPFPGLPKEFRYFFYPDGSENNLRKVEVLGSGVIINSSEGYVITNNHVVSNAEKIKIQLNDGREFDAKLVGSDEETDLALLQLPFANNITEIQIADSDTLKVGDFAVAVGNPFGLGQTATSGIISALGRSGLNNEELENFIQTDAAINSGNSGGALVNLNGELIGINTAILAPGGDNGNNGNIGIGFAIPSNIVKNLSQQLINFGNLKRGNLGIKGIELNNNIAKAFNIESQRGAFVSEVLPKSAADKAGIKAGDIIISVNGRKINSFSELRVKVATTVPGKIIKLGILRNSKLQEISVILDYKITHASSAVIMVPALHGAYFSNVQLNDGTKCVQVDDVVKNSPAAALGLEKGDIIIGINRELVHNLNQLREIIDSKPAVLALNILRKNNNIFILLS